MQILLNDTLQKILFFKNKTLIYSLSYSEIDDLISYKITQYSTNPQIPKNIKHLPFYVQEDILQHKLKLLKFLNL